MDAIVARGHAPGFDSSFVSRPRLIDKLVRSTDARVVLLTAPAGYSKTTCLAEWGAADGRPFAWVSASVRHDDPALLIASIVEAVGEIAPVDPDVLDSLSAPRPSISRIVLPRLERSVRAIDRPFVLVIDDAHALSSGKALETLRSLVDALPAGSQLALASRSEPPLGLGRLRANRQLFELGKEDLAMTTAESAELLAGIGLELRHDQLDSLHERTEGWPAALYLAGLALTDQPDVAAAVASFAGDDRIVGDYLRDELLATLPPAHVAFLTRSAILDELSGAACDAVLERADSARVLRELARSNALVVPLDRRDERYRYHHLLTEHLVSELRRREPELESELHGRASRWYETSSDPDRAIEHAIAAGDGDRAGELIWEAVLELTSRGRIATLERWLDQIEDLRTSSPTLPLASAHRHLILGQGEAAAHWVRVAESRAGDSGENRDSTSAHLHLLSATLSTGGVARMGDDAARAASMLPRDSGWQSPCFLYRGVAEHLTGHPDRAVELLHEAATRGAVVSSIIQVLSLSQLSLIAIETSGWHEASRPIAQAREQVGRCGLTGYSSMAMVFAVSALVRAHRGAIEAAGTDSQQAKRLLATISAFPPWYEVQARLALSRACSRLGDAPGAGALVEEASRLSRLVPDAVVLDQWLREATRAGGAAAAESRRSEFALTNAELRTLQYLPSHLSIPEIARRIQVSPNTVKTQVRAGYRKLSATSRAEAVAKARDAGLLDEDPLAVEVDRA